MKTVLKRLSFLSKQILFYYICEYLIRFMKTPDSLNQVALFHEIFNVPVVDMPQVPSEARCELRVALLEEELRELKQAIEEKDLTAVADALCDLHYVLSGAVLEFGLGKKFASLFDEVHRSNMSKACNNEKEAQETVDFYSTNGEECTYKKSGIKYHVHRVADDKVLKNKYYSPANLSTIIEQKDEE